MKPFIVCVAGLLFVCLLASCASRVAEGDDPVRPGLRDDVQALRPFVEKISVTVHYDPNILPMMATPYGPLDLQVTKPVSFEESSYLKNYYLGGVGAAFGLSRGETIELVGGPLCGPVCTEGYRERLVARLDDLESLVTSFRREENLRVYALARSTAPVIRINNLFYTQDNAVEHIPYGEAGLVPSPKTRRWESLEAYMEANGLDPAFMVDFLHRFTDTGIAAIVRDDAWTWVVLYGISDNEAGLIFVDEGADPPEPRQKLLNGKEFINLEPIRDGIWFYETS